MKLLTANTYRFEQEAQMRSGAMKDEMRQEPLFTSDMSLEEVVYYFQQHTQMMIKRMEDGERELASTLTN